MHHFDEANLDACVARGFPLHDEPRSHYTPEPQIYEAYVPPPSLMFLERFKIPKLTHLRLTLKSTTYHELLRIFGSLSTITHL